MNTMPNTASHWSQPALALAVPLRPALRDHESPVAQFLVVRRHFTL